MALQNKTQPAARHQPTIRGVSARVVTVACVLVGLLGGDWVLGRFVRPDFESVGLVFVPNTTTHIKTNEYQFDATINNLGFRGPNYPPAKRAATRILAIGDSSTFGWGTPLENTWVSQMEERLQQKQLDVEVFNLGSPGIEPSQYTAVLENALPVLRPNVVLLNILQGNDLAQSYGAPPPPPRKSDAEWRNETARKLLPNTMLLLKGPSVRPESDYEPRKLPASSDVWKEQAQQVVADLNDAERALFDNLDAEVRQSMLDGTTNPIILILVTRVNRTGAFLHAYDDEMLQEAIKNFGATLAEVQELCNNYGAELIAVSIPDGIYTAPEVLEGRRKLGIEHAPELLTTDLPDNAAQQSCDFAGVTLITVTEPFRATNRERPLFFPIDGHLNIDGNRVLGELVANELFPLIQ